MKVKRIKIWITVIFNKKFGVSSKITRQDRIIVDWAILLYSGRNSNTVVVGKKVFILFFYSRMGSEDMKTYIFILLLTYIFMLCVLYWEMGKVLLLGRQVSLLPQV